MARLTVKVHFAWWFRFYVWGLMTTVFLTRCEPDWVKVRAVIEQAARYRVVKDAPPIEP